MRNRLFMGALSVIGVAMSLTGCTNPSGLDSISISPSTQALAVGQSAQLGAIGTYGNGSHLSTQPVSSGVTWSSNATSVATVSATGAVTGVASGSATITATAQGFRGPVTATATVTVGATTGGGGSTGGAVVSVAVIPSAQSVATAGQTTQFIAIGTTSTGATLYLTNAVAWSSSTPAVATIGATTGLATAVGAGTTTITALYTDATTGSVVTGVATLTVTGGASEQYTALTITPGGETIAVGQSASAQLIALGTTGNTGLSEVVTDKVAWSSSISSIATVSATGVVTGVSAGATTITAIYTNTDSSVATASAAITVTSTPPPEPLLSLSIVPASLSVQNLQATGQFLAIGTFSVAPFVRDLTNSPYTSWISSFPDDFPVGTNSGGNSGASAGLVTAYASGGATIIAEYANDGAGGDGTIQTATATFSCPLALPNPNGDPPTAGSCNVGQSGPLLATLTVYNEGLNTTNWEITAPSATGTPDVIHCGPGWTGAGGSVCTATYPVGTTVTLTAPATGAAFGGWSYNCTNQGAVTAAGPNSCTVTLTGISNVDGSSTGDATVGAIFN